MEEKMQREKTLLEHNEEILQFREKMQRDLKRRKSEMESKGLTEAELKGMDINKLLDKAYCHLLERLLGVNEYIGIPPEVMGELSFLIFAKIHEWDSEWNPHNCALSEKESQYLDYIVEDGLRYIKEILLSKNFPDDIAKSFGGKL